MIYLFCHFFGVGLSFILANMSEPQQSAPPPLPIDPFRVNTDNIANISHAQAKPPAPRGRPPQKDRVEEKETAKSKKELEEKEKAFRAATQLAIEEQDKKKKREEESKKKIDEQRHLNKHKLYRKICEYKRTFPQVFETFKLPPSDSPEPVLQACLDDMRSQMSANAADQAVYAFIPKIGYAMEYVVHDVGFNPRGWRLRNGAMSLGKVLEDETVQEQLEPERSEAVIELRDYITAPWFVRLGFKFALIADQFTAHQPGHSSTKPENQKVSEEELSGL